MKTCSYERMKYFIERFDESGDVLPTDKKKAWAKLRSLFGLDPAIPPNPRPRAKRKIKVEEKGEAAKKQAVEDK